MKHKNAKLIRELANKAAAYLKQCREIEKTKFTPNWLQAADACYVRYETMLFAAHLAAFEK